MVYFKQDEEYRNYLDQLLKWSVDLEQIIRSDGKEQQNRSEEVNIGEHGASSIERLGLELEELVEEIKHCQVAIDYQLRPDYLHVLYERANRLYEAVKKDLDLSSQQETRQPEEQDEQMDPHAESGELISLRKNEQDGVQADKPVPIGGHRLPPLPYGYDALEPYISGEIMRLHHQKHHQSYVDGLNQAELKMEEARRNNQFDLLRHWQREAAFNGSGHYLHTIFWYNMHPKGGGKPKGRLAQQIERDFGSFTQFKRHFTEAAKQVEGAGWALLVWSSRSQRLAILAAEKHQHFAQWDVIPLLVLDVWEHAYYLQYKNDRAEYIKQWWNVVNWDNVEARFEKARQLRWTPY